MNVKFVHHTNLIKAPDSLVAVRDVVDIDLVTCPSVSTYIPFVILSLGKNILGHPDMKNVLTNS